MRRTPQGRLVTLLLAGAMVGVCGLSTLALYTTYRAIQQSDVRLRFLENAGVSAEITETLRFDVEPPASLTIDTAAGNIAVAAGEDDAITVEQTITGWGANEVAALAAAKAVTVRVERNPKSVRLFYRAPESVDIGSGRGGTDSASFTVRVPASTRVDLTTGAGSIDLTGTEAAAEIASSFGDVQVSDVRGALTVDSRSGALTIERVEAGDGDVTINSDFGDIVASEVAGRDIAVHSSAGKLTVSRLTAGGAARFESDFGTVDVENFRATSLTIESSNGAIDVTDGQVAGDLTVSDDFGDVTVTDVRAASYTATSQSGAVILKGGQGALKLSSAFGAITVTDAVAARLDLSSDNGSIAFSGSLDPAADHAVETDFGNITLALPPESRFDLRLVTSFGQIHSELPLTISGEIEEHAWSGQLNGGGRRLEATTQNGNVEIRALAGGPPPAKSLEEDSPGPPTASTAPVTSAVTSPTTVVTGTLQSAPATAPPGSGAATQATAAAAPTATTARP